MFGMLLSCPKIVLETEKPAPSKMISETVGMAAISLILNLNDKS